ncbi:hypothetical protein HHI36_021104 [Cryptolaemus montrouzieri]|uniref:Uncharacterized protein n=1 Tax=Cryptolaemus montrouzieri TaxID=559131 RepID=A0ABD2MWT0_9CUCU
MVRVISVHHFISQNVQTVEQPTACTTAPPDRFLLALMSNCIEVRDLGNNAEVLFTFPTVDEVAQICYSLNGDYVATLESKFNRQNREINFVRVYINWNSIATLQQSKMTNSGVSLGSSECGMVQPMRARIAGRVTPTSNQSDIESLEMIEVPVKRNPHAIACCPITGNLLILSNNILNIYKFKVKTHDISKMKFIDFEDSGIRIELSFEPSKIEMCENYIGAMSKENMQLFKLYKKCGKESAVNVKKSGCLDFSFQSQSDTIDYEQLLKDEISNSGKERVTVNLASIVRENSLIYKHSPFTFCDKEMRATVSTNSPLENKMCSYKVKNLIQLRLVPIMIDNAQRHIVEEFKTFVLKPLYVDEVFKKSKKETEGDNVFRSDFSKCLGGVSCMIATQQEGYLFHFDELGELSTSSDNCIAVYPFTAPIFQLVMEDYFLHALTETGLESYTLRIGHKICHSLGNVDSVNVACPPVSDAICLVGLRPFLGVEQILLANNHLLLLANADISPTHSVASNSSSNAVYWTLYSLELPTPKTVFNDISIVANIHRFSSSQTYCHLMNEAHMVLRIALLLKKWTTTDDTLKLVTKRTENLDDVAEMFRSSCLLLGDHFVMCSHKQQYCLAIPYYKMARIQAVEVIRRVKKIQEQSNSQFTKGLVHYLKHTMLSLKNGQEMDKLFSPNSKQNFLDELLNLLESYGFEDLPGIILRSRILQEYSTDKLIDMLTNKISGDFPKQAEKNLVLCILYIQKNNFSQARHCLEQIDVENLYQLLLDHWELLFDQNFNQSGSKGMTNFSELSDLVISHCTDRFADILVCLVLKKKVMHLNRLIKIFLEYLPSSIGTEQSTATLLLQRTLEGYFKEYFSKPESVDPSKLSYERGGNEALKLLVRSYLSQLQILQLKDENNRKNKENDYTDVKDTDDKEQDTNQLNSSQTNSVFFDDKNCLEVEEAFLFEKYKYEYLKRMPPFQIEIVSKMYSMCLEDYPTKEDAIVNEEADVVLAKLQAILCSPVISKNIIAEVDTFLNLNNNFRGRDSVRTIISTNKDAVQLLLESCPQCLVQFGKDRFTKTDDWQFLIASVQQKILKLSQDENLNRICFFYKKILKDTLSHVATSMTLEELMTVFPQRFSTNGTESGKTAENEENHEEGDNLTYIYSNHDLDIMNEIQNYEPYVVICKETMHANQIRKLIVTTGQQLLCTLNL